MVMSGVQKKIASRFIRMAIHNHIKGTYFKKGVHPTVEQVMQDINEDNLSTLLLYFTVEEIKTKIAESIRRQECKE